MAAVRSPIKLALVVALLVEALNLKFCAFPIDAGLPATIPWYTRLLADEWLLTHLPGVVSLGLLHGSQPDVIVVCHDIDRKEMLGHPGYGLPDVFDTIDLNLRLGRRTNSAIRCSGVSLNTSKLNANDAARLLETESARLGVPVADPMRSGAALEKLVDKCLA